MKIDLTIKNYRCFAEANPVRLRLEPGYTALIGVNNSGKSSLLRFFFELRPLFGKLSQPSSELIGFFQGQRSYIERPGFVADVEEIFSNSNQNNLEIDIASSGLAKNFPEHLIHIELSRPFALFNIKVKVAGVAIPKVDPSGNARFNESELWVNEKLIADFSNFFEIFRTLSSTYYVPPFRYISHFRPDAENGVVLNEHDIKVGQPFVAAWRENQGGNRKSPSILISRLVSEIRDIFGFSDLQIYPAANQHNLQAQVNGAPFRLSELGSGLAQFIVVLGNAAFSKPAFILIDEPELNLHPSLQMSFLTTLGSYASEGVLFATHNIGLARAAADRIYAVQESKCGSEVTEFERTPRLPQLLGELSFGGYQQLGSESVLLVEGRTDVKTVQQMLRALRKDHRVVTLPLGGGSMINSVSIDELLELKRITKSVSALIDSEKTKSDEQLGKSRKAFVKDCKSAGINCHVLKRRALENYFTDDAIKTVKGPKYRALKHYEKLNELNPAWAKNENWRIARAMTEKDLRRTDLGRFLEKL